MKPHNNKTAAYKIITDSGGNRYRFFCELSGMLMCETGYFATDTPDKELMLAWETEGNQFFNKCQKCGKWVSDVMYNADVLWCVDCAPWENKPRFCPECGKEVSLEDTYCRECGAKLQYSEVVYGAG